MAEQKKLKLGDVAMLDKNKIIHGLIENKNFNIKVFKPFCDLVKDFLNDFSNELKNQKETYSYPNLIYLTMWASKKNLKKLEKKFKSNQIRLGRGLIFHICPSNVPTNFIYSFFFGLLSGNSNIVKIPSKKFREKEIILSTIKSLFKKKKFFILKNSNCFIEYKNEIETTKKISSICDGRVIWGGDKTINEIRKVWIPERTIEITFSDRYSLSIININQLKKAKPNEIKLPEYEIKKNNSEISLDDNRDELLKDAAQLVLDYQQASVSLLQRKFRIGYSRAGRLIDELESMGIISSYNGSKVRDILVDQSYLKEIFSEE